MTRTLTLGAAMKDCIDRCQRCHAECLGTAMHMCLERAGRHTEPEHFRLMISCATLCQSAADLMLGGSEFHEGQCALCAVACEACAQSCEDIGGMEDCVEACRECAQSCREMSGGLARERSPAAP
jgi:hypothetical protein